MRNADVFKIWLATVAVWLPLAWLISASLLAEIALQRLGGWLLQRGNDDLGETLTLAGEWLPRAMGHMWPVSWMMAASAAVGLGLLLEHGARRRASAVKKAGGEK